MQNRIRWSLWLHCAGNHHGVMSFWTLSFLSFLVPPAALRGACKHCSALWLFLGAKPLCSKQGPGQAAALCSEVHRSNARARFSGSSLQWAVPSGRAAQCHSESHAPSRWMLCHPSNVILVWPDHITYLQVEDNLEFVYLTQGHILFTSHWPYSAARDSGKQSP